MSIIRHFYAVLSVIIMTSGNILAQPALDLREYDSPSGIAPAFFGPNAFPVPDMTNGKTSPDLMIELYADQAFGAIGSGNDDYTISPFLRIKIPLFSPRVNLTVWGNVYEYFNTSPLIATYRKVGDKGILKGWSSGDIYVSTEFMVLTQEKHQIDLLTRVALKSASGDRYMSARYYDNMGYFFDATAGKEFCFKDGNTSLRLAVSTGFLCWQIETGRQNDAIMYGLQASLYHGPANISIEYGGYSGWENYGDRPMTIKVLGKWSFQNLSVCAAYHRGLNDWPFNMYRLGLSYSFKIY